MDVIEIYNYGNKQTLKYSTLSLISPKWFGPEVGLLKEVCISKKVGCFSCSNKVSAEYSP